MRIEGAAWKFGDNINTDLIFPNRFFKPAYEPGEMGAALLRGADPDFPTRFRAGDIIVAGRNFGCGSSREEAAGAMKEAGVGAIVASSLGRLFMRNCINLGVPVATCAGVADHTEPRDELVIDLAAGELFNKTNGHRATFPTMAPELLRLLSEGGLKNYTVKVLAERKAAVR